MIERAQSILDKDIRRYPINHGVGEHVLIHRSVMSDDNGENIAIEKNYLLSKLRKEWLGRV